MRDYAAASSLIVALALLLALHGVNGDNPYRYYTWKVTYGDIYPLGVKQQGILINGQFPGPTIDCVTNDNLIISVYNYLNEPFLLSWNGLQQRRNSWQDGVSGTNCPILPRRNYTYALQAKDQIGTYFYFPSLGLHKAAGGYGSIKVYSRPQIPVPFPPPAGDHVVLAGDWFKRSQRQLRYFVDGGHNLPFPDGLIINGRGWNGYTFTVEQGKTYRFRISNVGTALSLNFRIQGHLMKLVEVEGSHTVQNTYSSLDVHLGQSYSVLVTANQPAKDYYVVVSSRFTSKVLTTTAVHLTLVSSLSHSWQRLFPASPCRRPRRLAQPSRLPVSLISSFDAPPPSQTRPAFPVAPPPPSLTPAFAAAAVASVQQASSMAVEALLRAAWIACTLPLLAALIPFPKINAFRHFVLQLAVRGKIMDSSSRKFTIPQKYFCHFYIVGVIWTTFLLVTTWIYAYKTTAIVSESSLYSSIASQLTGVSHELSLHKSHSSVGDYKYGIWKSVFLLLLMEAQILRRLIESIYVFKYSPSARMHIAGYLTGLFFYTAAPLSLCCTYSMEVFKLVANLLVEFIVKGKDRMQVTELSFWGHVYPLLQLKWYEWIGAAFFLWGWIHQLRCHAILGSIRENGHKVDEYAIPEGDWFEYVSSPHYLAEFVIYGGLVIASGFYDITIWLVFVFVVANLSLAAGETHKWYIHKFDNYPRNRYAIIPFIY